jgi:hypothetical protein
MRKAVALLLVLTFLTASCVIMAKPVLSIADKAEDAWTAKAPMNQARGGLGVAVINEKIYAIGGMTAKGIWPVRGGLKGTNEEYDPVADKWTYKASMPTPRAFFAIGVYQNKIYCIGGEAVNGHTGVNEVYNPATNTWETKASMPGGPNMRTSLAANVIDDEIYIIDPFSRINYVYEPATDSWTTKAPIPNAAKAMGYASVVVDNTICYVGAFSDSAFNLNQIYIPETDEWRFGANTLSAVYSATAGATSGMMAPERVYIFGTSSAVGNTAISAPSFVNQVYNPENDSWSYGASPPTARIDSSIVTIKDALYMIGGYTYTGLGLIAPSAVNERYTPFGYGTVPPTIDVVSPVSKTYNESDVDLVFTVNKAVDWTGYSVDGGETVTITGNVTLEGLANGVHNVTVYARDAFGNVGASETVSFTVDVPFPVTMVVAPIASVAVVGAGLILYFKRRRRSA